MKWGPATWTPTFGSRFLLLKFTAGGGGLEAPGGYGYHTFEASKLP